MIFYKKFALNLQIEIFDVNFQMCYDRDNKKICEKSREGEKIWRSVELEIITSQDTIYIIREADGYPQAIR